MTRDEALEILASGQFEPFVGPAESLEVEVKGAPYNLNGDPNRQKFELVKDVAALANAAGGGVIVIGAATARDPEPVSMSFTRSTRSRGRSSTPSTPPHAQAPDRP